MTILGLIVLYLISTYWIVYFAVKQAIKDSKRETSSNNNKKNT